MTEPTADTVTILRNVATTLEDAERRGLPIFNVEAGVHAIAVAIGAIQARQLAEHRAAQRTGCRVEEIARERDEAMARAARFERERDELRQSLDRCARELAAMEERAEAAEELAAEANAAQTCDTLAALERERDEEKIAHAETKIALADVRMRLGDAERERDELQTRLDRIVNDGARLGRARSEALAESADWRRVTGWDSPAELAEFLGGITLHRTMYAIQQETRIARQGRNDAERARAIAESGLADAERRGRLDTLRGLALGCTLAREERNLGQYMATFLRWLEMKALGVLAGMGEADAARIIDAREGD